jgi:hypothetical protein
MKADEAGGMDVKVYLCKWTQFGVIPGIFFEN